MIDPNYERLSQLIDFRLFTLNDLYFWWEDSICDCHSWEFCLSVWLWSPTGLMAQLELTDGICASRLPIFIFLMRWAALFMPDHCEKETLSSFSALFDLKLDSLSRFNLLRLSLAVSCFADDGYYNTALGENSPSATDADADIISVDAAFLSFATTLIRFICSCLFLLLCLFGFLIKIFSSSWLVDGLCCYG